MSGNKFDPVEEAKIEAPSVKPAAPRRNVKEAEPPPAPAAKAEVKPQPPVPAPPPASVPPQATAAQMASPKFRVVKEARISWMGSITYLSKGSMVLASAYGGAEGVAKLVAQGVELEPVND